MNTSITDRGFKRLTLPVLAVTTLLGCASLVSVPVIQTRLKSQTIPLLTVDGLQFKDLNKNGVLEPYEDWRKSPEERAKDLVSRMTVAEKAGAMMHGNPPSTASNTMPGAGSAWDIKGISTLILEKNINSYINRISFDVTSMATQYNEVQTVAEKSRLGIPVTFSTDPRSQFKYVQGVSVNAGNFTQWPDPSGLSATGDAQLARKFADSVRQEYLAVGIRVALSPQADITIEPKWHRANGTFGSNKEMIKDFVQAYVEGMQNGDAGIGKDSVVSVVKHWVGYGSTPPDGYDSHTYYGRHLAISSSSMEDHIFPFTGAFAAKVGSVMPTYGQPPEGLFVKGSEGPIERVGMGFNKQMLTEVLRGRFKFNGVILSDWQIMDDCNQVCREGTKDGSKATVSDFAMPWGVENLSKEERFAKAIAAGVDQFGGAKEPDYLVDLVRKGRIRSADLDGPVYRIMLQKFQQGLFENPYVDVAAASKIVGNARFKEASLDAQRRSVVLIQNRKSTLPLNSARTKKIYLYNIDPAVARQYGFAVVDRPEDADVAVIGVSTPYEVIHPNFFFGARYREGDTGFKDGNPDYEEFKRVSAKVPTVVSVYVERPPALDAIVGKSAAIVANFGLSHAALFDVLTGKFPPHGKLPYDLPHGTAYSTDIAHRYAQGLTYSSSVP